MRRRLSVGCLLSAWLVLHASARGVSNSEPDRPLSRFEFVETHMGCSFKIVLYCADEPAARRASRLAFERVKALDDTLSDYKPESELSRLGEKSGGPPVPVSADLFDVLALCQRYHKKTGGVLDATIAPVGRLWRRARRDRKLPDPARLAEARALVGAEKMILDPAKRTVRLTLPGMKLDVGGVAKGHAAQAALEVLRAQGVRSALVAAAGDIVVGDPPPGASGWTIAVAGLDPAHDAPEAYLLLANRAISTSGDSERFVVIDGHRYSHIINPVTGMGVEERASVTVVAPDGGAADALETSVYLLGPEKGLKLIDAMPGTAALYVRSTPQGMARHASARFRDIPRAEPKETPAQAVRPKAAGLPERPAFELGFDPVRLARIDAAMDRAMAEQVVPGAVVLVGRHGAIAYARACGHRGLTPQREPMTRDTVFDMASLTKPVATATAVLLLIEEGKVRLGDRAAHFLPEFAPHGKDRITVEHLLRHRAGLVADNSLRDYDQGPEAAWKRICDLELITPPGQRFAYSDVGFMILGKLVERVSGVPLDRFARERIFQPAGMADAHFRRADGTAPTGAPDAGRIAPTEPAAPGGPMLRGAVHDPRARALGGTAGHAGLFATADDLAAFASTLLSGGLAPSGKRILSPLSVRVMFDAGGTPPGERRGLGWDIATSYSSPRGALFGGESLGHTGFTGTSLWIDPETGVFVIVLTSRLHPDGKKPSPSALRSKIGTLAAAALVDVPARRRGPAVTESSASGPAAAPSREVQCGIDVLIANGFTSLKGQRVGLVTNQTGRARDGRSTVDVLARAPGVTLVRLFSPEHGPRGDLDAKVPDGKDQATGLPIVSLYGAKQKPTPQDLQDLDTLVFDIQDIGVRYYTYSSTLGLVLEAVQAAGKRLVVLDRPNPLGGRAVAGPLRDDDLASFIAYHALPVRHGLTVGELARLYNGERGLKARLEVVPCRGWSRDATFDRTGLVWVNPSPNMRSLTEAMLYPGVGWLEATNLATGRGTDTPFERLGAPWIEPAAFARALNSAGVAGARFVPTWFVPSERQYQSERCGGVQIFITDWSAFEPVRLGLALATTLKREYPTQWKPEGVLRMLGDRRAYQAILDGKSPAEVEALWQPELEEFRRVRSGYLLYD